MSDNKRMSPSVVVRELNADAMFLDVRSLEERYGMSWDVFFVEYTSGKLVPEGHEQSGDYAKWAFLCTAMAPLLASHEEFTDTGPPTECSRNYVEPRSGALFFSVEAFSLASRTLFETNSKRITELPPPSFPSSIRDHCRRNESPQYAQNRRGSPS